MFDALPEPQFICDASGFKRPLSELVVQWDGARVARQFCDIRNPQDFVRGVPDRQNLPICAPEPPDVFLDPLDPVTPGDL